MPSLQARIDRALDTICKAVNLVHTTTLILIVTTTFLVSFFFYFIYPPLILLVLFLSFLCVLYVNRKKGFIAQVIDDIDEQSAVEEFNYRQAKRQQRQSKQSPHQQNQHRHRHVNLARRLLFSVVDNFLGVARDYALLVPSVTAFIATVAFLFRYYTLAIVALVVTILLVGTVCCCYQCIKLLAHNWVDWFFDHDSHHNRSEGHRAAGEKTPLLRASV